MSSDTTNNDLPVQKETHLHIRWGTSASYDMQDAYMKQVSQYPPLSVEEEGRLTQEFGLAKKRAISALRRFPSIFIEMLRMLRDENSSYRLSNYFINEEFKNDDESDIRAIFKQVSGKIVSLSKEEAPSQPANAPAAAINAVWKRFTPLTPKQFLYKRAALLLEDTAWRKKVLTDWEWRNLQDILKDSMEIMSKATNTLVEHNLRLVISIASRYVHCGIPLQDLIQEGNIGLIHSIEKFDHTLGHRFSTYASYWIRQAITRNITNHSRIIRMPANTVALISQIRQIEQEILNDDGNLPTPEIIAGRLNISAAKVRALQEMMQQPISLHSIISEDKALLDTIPDQQTPQPSEATDVDNIKDAVTRLLNTLTDRERKIISMHFGLDGEEQQTLTSISHEMGLSSERIRQIEIRALHKLRMPSGLKILEEYGK